MIQENGIEVVCNEVIKLVYILKVSGFIDLAQRVKKENFMAYLTGQKQPSPRPGDLSYANLSNKKSRLCSSDNWQVRRTSIKVHQIILHHGSFI